MIPSKETLRNGDTLWEVRLRLRDMNELTQCEEVGRLTMEFVVTTPAAEERDDVELWVTTTERFSVTMRARSISGYE